MSGGTYKFTHFGVTAPAPDAGKALCLDVDFNDSKAGTSVGQYLDNGLDSQRFILEGQPDGSYKIRHKGTVMYVQPVGLATAATTKIEQNVASTSDAQKWIITPDAVSGPGVYKLSLKGTTNPVQVLEIGFGSNAPGARVNLYDDNGFVPAQRWLLTAIAPLATINARNSGLTAEAYPNPVGPGQRLMVQVNAVNNGPADLDVLDVLGHKVCAQAHALKQGVNNLEISNTTLAAGVYIVRLRQGNCIQQTRLVQQ